MVLSRDGHHIGGHSLRHLITSSVRIWSTFRGRRIFLPMAAWVLSGFGDSRAVVVYIFLTWLGTLAAIVITGRWRTSKALGYVR